MAPSQHQADARIARYLMRLSDGTAGRKALFFLETVAWAWGPERRSCFDGVKHRVVPTRDDVALVASYGGASRPAAVRIAVLAALAQAGPLAEAGLDAIREGLAASDRRVRLTAARAAAEAKLGDALGRELRGLLGDEVWAVRWYAARALAPRAYDGELGSLAHMLVTSTPRGGMSLAGWARAVEALRPRCRVAGQASELDAHVRTTLASLSPRDRDFVWPLRD